MDWIFSLYVGATIFGAGVTVIDLAGLFGNQEGGGSSGDDDISDAAPAMEGDAAAESDTPAAEAEAEYDIEGVSAEAQNSEDTDTRTSLALHDAKQKKNILFEILQIFRSAVYFSLGFGPVGWFAVATGSSPTESLAWSVPVGLVSLAGTRFLRRFMQKSLDSQLKDSDFLMEKGVVIVTIGKGQMGKVRVKIGDTYAERFARAEDPAKVIPLNADVRVVNIDRDCIYVEPE